ncbi:MAG: chromate resistance protein ChrB domain-containing protein [Candidatus Bathyarchaeia archaeon]
MKWVTREKAKVDRIACPWLITHFVDEKAEFLFVQKERVQEVAKVEGAIPFDAPGVELTHYQEHGKTFVSFDAIIKKYRIKDEALGEMARIVRAADAHIPDAPPESAGLEAAAIGFRELTSNDFENMKVQFPLYDTLYKYCQVKAQKGVGLEHAVP